MFMYSPVSEADNADEQQLSSLHHRVSSQWLFSWGSLIARPVNSKIILVT